MAEHTAPAGEHGDHGHDHGFAHPAPPWILLGTFFALIFLTILTVGIAASPLAMGSFEIWVSMGIATAKALLVCLFFMHMFWDKGFNVLVFLSSLLFVSLFAGFSLMDQYQTAPNVETFPVEQTTAP